LPAHSLQALPLRRPLPLQASHGAGNISFILEVSVSGRP
jgi:hypothetical protein